VCGSLGIPHLVQDQRNWQRVKKLIAEHEHPLTERVEVVYTKVDRREK
jgi:hypothetical protein